MLDKLAKKLLVSMSDKIVDEFGLEEGRQVLDALILVAAKSSGVDGDAVKCLHALLPNIYVSALEGSENGQDEKVQKETCRN